MIGEQITNLCKTISIMDEVVQMGEKLKIVDHPHVMAMDVESLDGSPIFGIESDKMLNPEEVVKMKITPKAEFNVWIKDDLYTLTNDDSFFKIPMIEPTINESVRIPDLNLLRKVEVSGKMLKDVIGQVSSISDHVTFSIEDGNVWVTAEDTRSKVGRKLATTEHDDIKSKFLADYLKKIMKVAGSNLTIGLYTDHPMTFEWCDNYYNYKVLLAPRIEAD